MPADRFYREPLNALANLNIPEPEPARITIDGPLGSRVSVEEFGRKTVYDMLAARDQAVEGAIRQQLMAMGWTPPDADTLEVPADVLDLLDQLEDAREDAGRQDTMAGQALGAAINWIMEHAKTDGLNDAYAEGRKDEAEEQSAARATLTEALSTAQAALQTSVKRSVLMREFLTLEQQERFDAAWLARQKAPETDDHPEADFEEKAVPHPAGLAGAHLAAVVGDNCACRTCLRARDARDAAGWPILMGTFIVCLKCGNKRCPHANDHANACTGSNEPGQAGAD